MVTRRIPDPKIGGSIPSGVKKFFFEHKTTATRFEEKGVMRESNSRPLAP